MRTLRKNRQRMFYSLYKSAEPIYETDDDGNIKYMEIDGELVPIKVGYKTVHYDAPVRFKANIYSQISEAHMKAYGIDKSSIYSELVVGKGALPLNYGSLIWRESEIIYEDEEQTTPKQSSADYTVVGIMTEGLNTDAYLLQRNSSESDNNG